MKLIDLKNWTVEYDSNTELYTVIDPLGNKCVTRTVRIISPEHFVITHPKLPDEHIFPGRSIPCLGKDFCGNLQRLLCGNATRIKMGKRICIPDNRVMKTHRSRKSSTVPYCG